MSIYDHEDEFAAKKNEEMRIENEAKLAQLNTLFKPIEFDLDKTITANYMLVSKDGGGILPEGLSAIAGPAGIGKSTFVSHCALVACGAMQDEHLTTTSSRKVVYFSEDCSQFERILKGYRRAGLLASDDYLRQWLFVIPAERYRTEDVWKHLHIFLAEERFKTQFDADTWVPPWCILDTESANLEIEDKNSAVEVDRIMRALKTQYHSYGMSFTVVAHVTKASAQASFDDFRSMTIGGSAAFENHPDTVLILALDKETGDKDMAIEPSRYAIFKKSRITVKASRLKFEVDESYKEMAVDRTGAQVELTLPICSVVPVSYQDILDDRKQADEKPFWTAQMIEKRLFEYYDHNGFWMSEGKSEKPKDMPAEWKTFKRIYPDILRFKVLGLAKTVIEALEVQEILKSRWQKITLESGDYWFIERKEGAYKY